MLALDGTILSANAAALALFEADSLVALIAKDIFISPAESDMAELLAGKVARLEREFISANGIRRAIEIVNVPVCDSTGVVDHVVGYARDFTEMREAEHVHRMFSAIVESSDDAIISIGPDLRILTWNEAAHRLLGYSVEEAIGQEALQLYVAPDYRDLARQNMLEDFAAQSPAAAARRVEVPLLRKDGTLIDVSLVASQLRNSQGAVIGMSAIIRDMSERRRAEREQAMLATIVNASEDAIITISTDDKILSWNPAAQRDYGFTAEQAIGQRMDLFVPPEELPKALQKIHQVFETGKPVTWQQRRNETKDSISLVTVFPTRDQAGNIIGVTGIGRDISKLKTIETELREARDYTRGLIESSIDSMVVVDCDLRITDANERFATLAELPKKLLIGTRFDSYFTEPSQASTAVEKALAKGYITDSDLVLRTASGRELLVSFNASTCWRDGKILGIFGVARDVSEQRAIERTLRDEREYSRSLVQFSPDALLVSDQTFVISDVNERAVQLTGYARTELIGTNLFTLFTDAEQISRIVTPSPDGEPVTYGESTLFAKTANRVPVSVSVSQLKDSDGNPRLVAVGLRDISERKRIEKERSLLASIVDSSGDAIFSESPDMTITSWNAAAEALFGYSAAEIVGRSVALLVPLGGRAQLFQNFADLHKIGKSQHFESRGLHKDGSSIDVAITQSPIFDSTGRLTALSVIARDITERKRIEAELLEARDSALEAARLKSEFLANMSHEIRTPLNSIIGLTGLLLETELNREQCEFAHDVRESGETLLTLINEILDFSKLAAGRVTLEKVDFELSDTIASVTELVAEQVRRKQLEITVSIDAEVPQFLKGDPTRLRQVLLNLVANAVKFTEQGEVSVQVSKLSENPRSAILRFEVTDTGIGIANDKLHLLFQPFTQVDASTTRRFGGTGLGLSIARELVQRMNGTIAVSSTPGRGSTFWFTAEFSKQAVINKPDCERSLDLNDAAVLIVDDNSNSRAVLMRQVSALGMKGTAVSSAEEALALIRAGDGTSFKYALIDAMMPGIDGIELTRRIKAEPALAKTAVIIVSSIGTRSEFGARLKGLEIADWLMKPLRQSTLRDSLINASAARGARPKLAGEQNPVRKDSTEPTRASKPSTNRHLRVLVAEDNSINQKVIRLQLKKLAVDADVVANGREAVEAVSRLPYDLVFM
ncbi:MAG TPA: PAS domain S-box protein, partial [Candidatus Binataceae bacterium]|nr:PAS domain S-box protein [Candidatus Binataceae bacterium]